MSSLLAAPRAAGAQQAGKVYRSGGPDHDSHGFALLTYDSTTGGGSQ